MSIIASKFVCCPEQSLCLRAVSVFKSTQIHFLRNNSVNASLEQSLKNLKNSKNIHTRYFSFLHDCCFMELSSFSFAQAPSEFRGLVGPKASEALGPLKPQPLEALGAC